MNDEIDPNGCDLAVARRLEREYNTLNWTDEDAADVRLPLADEYLARVTARVLAAPTGAWRIDRGEAIGDNWVVATGVGYDDAEPGSWAVATAEIHASDINGADGYDAAAFLAHCRLDVPLLLLEIERLRARVAALEARP